MEHVCFTINYGKNYLKVFNAPVTKYPLDIVKARKKRNGHTYQRVADDFHGMTKEEALNET